MDPRSPLSPAAPGRGPTSAGGLPPAGGGATRDGRDELLRIDHLTKQFDGVTVLDRVTLSLGRGEVHGLAGHNGSGKSTLVKCLSGFHQPTGPWSLSVAGHHLARALQPGEPARLGITFVHQDLGLLPELSVLENLLLFRMGTDRRPFVAWRRETARAKRLFATFGITVDPRATLSSLRPVEQAQVAIVRAVAQLHAFRSEHPDQQGVLVLDEATTFLDRPGRAVLHTLIRSISADGYGVLFVSHDIEELLSVTDRITVLREGQVIATRPSADLDHDEVVRLIVTGAPGRGPAPASTAGAPSPAPAVAPAAAAPTEPEASRSPSMTAGPGASELRVEGLAGEFLRGVDLSARRGEIVGVTGIIGGGWELVPDLLYGARRATQGTVRFGSRTFPAHRSTPERSLRSGIVYVPPDRQAQAVVGQLSVQENVMLPVLGHSFRRGHLQLGHLFRSCRHLLHAHAVHPSEPRAPISTLSGGNQQKAVLAKWLQLGPQLVLLNEPTQGVDVGARQLIMDEIRRLAAGGAIVLYASGNWDEIVRIADRVVVVADGQVAGELTGAEVTVDVIAAAAYRGTQNGSDATAASEIWEMVS